LSEHQIEINAAGIRVRAAPIVVAIIASLATIVAASISVFFQGATDAQVSMKLENSVREELSVAIKGIEVQLNEIGAINQRIDKLTSLPENAKVSAQLEHLNTNISNIEKRLHSLEKYLLESPGKALALPLLSKEIDSLKTNYKSERVDTDAEIARIYDQNKWFIGLMFTMAVSVLGLAISNLFQGKNE